MKFKSIYASLSQAYLQLPRLLRLGILAFVVSGAMDLSYHIVSSFRPGSLDAYLGPDGYYTHLALFLSMLLIIIGVIRTHPAPAAIHPNLENPIEVKSRAEMFHANRR